MLDRETRLALLLDHYRRPRHRAPLPDADTRAAGGNPGCGDVVTIYLQAAPDGARIHRASFDGSGCTLSQAAASMLMERVNRDHPTLDEVTALSYQEVIATLGEDLVQSRPSCATLALGTLKAAVRSLELDQRLRAAGRTEEEIRALKNELAERLAEPGLTLTMPATPSARRSDEPGP